MLTTLVQENPTFYIYGAQVVAYSAYRAIKHLTGKQPQNFLVGNKEGNPAEIEGIEVITPENVSRDSFIIVAVSELLQGEIVADLRQRGFNDLYLLTANAEHLLMQSYFDSLGIFPLILWLTVTILA